MKEQIDIIDIGMTFQMSLDAFLEESHVGYTKMNNPINRLY